MTVMLWFVVYLLLILALASWRAHHDAARTKKRRRTDEARAGGLRHQVGLRPVRGILRRPHRTS